MEIAGLCRWDTDAGESRSLQDYIDVMPEGQDKIYYVSGDSRAQCEMNPAMEGLKSKGYECIFATEPLDEIALQGLGKFGDKDFEVKDAAKEDFEEGKEGKEGAEEELKGVIDFLKERSVEAKARVCVFWLRY